MSALTVHGFPQSTYVRTIRLACEEKGVAYVLQDLDFGSAEHRALHPFGKMPAMTHGDLTLYETSAICGYIDETFEGPALQPRDTGQRALMNQWVSAINDYLYATMARAIIIPRLVYPMRGLTPDEAAIEAAKPDLVHQLGIVEAALAGNDYLAGDALSLADLFLVPIVFWLHKTPEGQAALPDYPAVNRWYEAIAARPSFAATEPPMPQQNAA